MGRPIERRLHLARPAPWSAATTGPTSALFFTYRPGRLDLGTNLWVSEGRFASARGRGRRSHHIPAQTRARELPCEPRREAGPFKTILSPPLPSTGATSPPT